MNPPAPSKPLSIWVTGSPVPAAEAARGSFAAMIQRAVGDAWPGRWSEVDTQREAPDPRAAAGVIVTGSPARVADQEAWMRWTQDALRECLHRQVPVLGICFGHQLLGMALGGRSGPNPRGREIGTVGLTLRGEDPLLGAQERFAVQMTHLDSVLELPPGAEVLASTEVERHAAVRFGPRAWGVQYHPEMDAEIIGAYLEARREALTSEGLDAAALLAERRETPRAAAVLPRFARGVLTGRW